MSEKVKNEIMENIFNIMAPGQPLRNGIDRIKDANLGALIVLAEPNEIKNLMEGGFVLSTDFTPQKLYELAKMDGAVIISKDITKIYGANMQLQPDYNIETDESGTRHRTAHRMAIQTGNMVITVSERRNKITVFKDKFKYILDSIADILIKSSQAIMSLEKYSSITAKYLNNLNFSELENVVTLDDVISGIRFYSLLFNMDKKVRQYILELGTESKIIELQYKEIMLGQKINFINLIKDYLNYENEKTAKPEKIFEKISDIDKIDITDDEVISKLLGYDLKIVMTEDILVAKGYRLLSNINRLSKKEIENIIDEFFNINNILNANIEQMQKVKGITKNKASKIIRINTRYKNTIKYEKQY